MYVFNDAFTNSGYMASNVIKISKNELQEYSSLYIITDTDTIAFLALRI